MTDVLIPYSSVAMFNNFVKIFFVDYITQIKLRILVEHKTDDTHDATTQILL